MPFPPSGSQKDTHYFQLQKMKAIFQPHNLLFGVLFGLLAAACGDAALYTEYKEIPSGSWHIDSTAVFEVPIADASRPYNLYFLVRNSSDYPFYNLYTYASMLHNGDTLFAGMEDRNLMHPKTGKPLGAGIGDFFNHDFMWKEDYTFPDTGTYHFHLQQFMRVDSLDGIQAVGIKIMEPPVEE